MSVIETTITPDKIIDGNADPLTALELAEETGVALRPVTIELGVEWLDAKGEPVGVTSHAEKRVMVPDGPPGHRLSLDFEVEGSEVRILLPLGERYAERISYRVRRKRTA